MRKIVEDYQSAYWVVKDSLEVKLRHEEMKASHYEQRLQQRSDEVSQLNKDLCLVRAQNMGFQARIDDLQHQSQSLEETLRDKAATVAMQQIELQKSGEEWRARHEELTKRFGRETKALKQARLRIFP